MKRILLAGNGFDIQFNNEFCQEKNHIKVC
jgi:hypothetical protein